MTSTMASPVPVFQPGRQQRAHQRLTCQLIFGSQRHPAIVRDISPLGRFVQTRARPEPESRVLTVRSQSAEGARAQALSRAGRGGQVADIQEL